MVTNIASMASQALVASRRFRINLALLMCATAVTALACVWLVPLYALEGAAVAIIVGMVVMSIGGCGADLSTVRNLA
jgi:O-antigen/teichoic acid export membrane protein